VGNASIFTRDTAKDGLAAIDVTLVGAFSEILIILRVMTNRYRLSQRFSFDKFTISKRKTKNATSQNYLQNSSVPGKTIFTTLK